MGHPTWIWVSLKAGTGGGLYLEHVTKTMWFSPRDDVRWGYTSTKALHFSAHLLWALQDSSDFPPDTKNLITCERNIICQCIAQCRGGLIVVAFDLFKIPPHTTVHLGSWDIILISTGDILSLQEWCIINETWAELPFYFSTLLQVPANTSHNC